MPAWNILFFLFVLLPFLSGGIWYSGEKIYIEYTQVGVAAFILAIVLWFFWKKNNKVFSESYFLRKIICVWDLWKKDLEKKYPPLLFCAFALFALLRFFASLRRHHAFSSSAADLGIFTNTIWNLTNGNGYISSIKGGLNLLSDHQSYFFFLLSPFFYFWQTPECLLLLQAVGLASSGIAVFLLAKQKLGKENYFVALAPLVFWAFQPIRSASLFDFHPEVFMLPLFLFAIWALQEQSWKKRFLGSLLFLLALLTKESAGPIAVGISLAWLAGAAPPQARAFTIKFSFFAAILGIGIFLFNLKMMPQFFQSEYNYAGSYSELGPGIWQILLSPFTKTWLFLQHIFGISRLKFLFAVLAPFLFLPLLSWRQFIAAIPGFLMLFLTDGPQRVGLGFHYAIEPSVGILWAFVNALALPGVIKKRSTILFALAWACIIFYGRNEVFHIRHFVSSPYQSWVRKEVLPKLSAEPSFAAPSAIVPHISLRSWIHFLPVLQKNDQSYVDCILIEPNVDNSPLSTSSSHQIREVIESSYEREFSCPNAKLEIYRNKSLIGSCLVNEPKCPSSEVASTAQFH